MTEVLEILNEFKRMAKSPRKQLEKYLDDGKKVVACVPVYTPEEVVHSMGLIPFGTWGADMEIEQSKSYFPAFICGITQSILELGMKGEYDGVSAIIIPSLCDSLKCLGENWKYGVDNIPFIPMTYPQNRRTKAGHEFTKAGYERVISDLTTITGHEFSEQELERSIEIYNEHNQAMRELSHLLASYPSISAKERNAIFKSAYFCEKEEHTQMVKKCIALLKESPEEEIHKTKIITSGIILDNENFLDILDENQLQIVGDDIAHESRQYRVDTNLQGDPLLNLSEKFGYMDNCSVLFDPDKKRATYITDMVKERKAEGVLVALTKFCDPEEFDYVMIKKECDRQNIPCMQVEIDRQMVNYEQAKTLIETFKENI